MPEKCPEACDIRVTHLEERVDKADDTHGDLFSKINLANACINKRVKTVTLLGLATVVVIVLGAAFMLLYNQGSSIVTQIGLTHQRITGLEVSVATVQEQLRGQKEDIRELKEGH